MIFRAKKHELDLASRALVMGILNVTVDSFSDGGKFLSPEKAVERALQMADEGAAIIDIGGESTRPGAEPVHESEEMARVLPVIGALAGGPFLISIDTSKASVAREAVARGASIINDVTGLRGDPEMIAVARETGTGVIVMHMQGTPRTMQLDPRYENDEPVAVVRDFFRQSFDRAVGCGIDPMCIAFDPGIGFGKSAAHNFSLLNHLAELRAGDRPLVVGVSRKSFIGKALGTDSVEARDRATAVLTALASERGANIVRVHDVRQNVEALWMTDAVLGEKPWNQS